MHISTALQEDLLNEIVDKSVPVAVFLVNGFQIRGTILDHDDAVVVLETEGRQQIVYKHAISTISPFRSLETLKEK